MKRFFVSILMSFAITVSVNAQSVVWHASSSTLDRGKSIVLSDSANWLEAGSGWLCSIGPVSGQLPAYEARQITCSFEKSSLQFSVQCDPKSPQDHTQVRVFGSSTDERGFIEVGCTLSDFLNASSEYSTDFSDTLKRAEAGDLIAQGDLAVKYEIGLGVPESYMNAYMWFSIAVAQSDTASQRELYSLGKDRVKLRLSPQALEKAQAAAAACFESNFKDCGQLLMLDLPRN